jgi:glucose-6-phosphate dehydrogenase assembly protein OpcA
VTTLWDTTGTEVVKALAAERRAAGAVTSGLALTLVVVVDEKRVAEAEEAATQAASMHPFRLLVVVRRALETESRLDAEVLVGGRLGPGEAVVMRMYGRLTLHAESVALPLFAPDTPVVTWWHGVPPEKIAFDPLGVYADRRITDCAQAEDPIAALRARAEDYAPGDTDLAWTRTTGWRSLLAAAIDPMQGEAKRISVSAEQGNPSAPLLAGWLGRRLDVKVAQRASNGPGITGVKIGMSGVEEVSLSRKDGRTATLHGAGTVDRTLPLPRRELGDLLAEELRRLTRDEPYASALEAATGQSGLNDRPGKREHIWVDPADQRPGEEPALVPPVGPERKNGS